MIDRHLVMHPGKGVSSQLKGIEELTDGPEIVVFGIDVELCARYRVSKVAHQANLPARTQPNYSRSVCIQVIDTVEELKPVASSEIIRRNTEYRDHLPLTTPPGHRLGLCKSTWAHPAPR